MFSSKSLIVSGITLRSSIHFEFIFVYGVREHSNFILLHVAVQFSQLIEEAVLSQLYILSSFVKGKVTICAWIYLWAFCSVSLIHMSVFVPVLHCFDYCSLKPGRVIPPALFFFLRIALAILDLLCANLFSSLATLSR